MKELEIKALEMLTDLGFEIVHAGFACVTVSYDGLEFELFYRDDCFKDTKSLVSGTIYKLSQVYKEIGREEVRASLRATLGIE